LGDSFHSFGLFKKSAAGEAIRRIAAGKLAEAGLPVN